MGSVLHQLQRLIAVQFTLILRPIQKNRRQEYLLFAHVLTFQKFWIILYVYIAVYV